MSKFSADVMESYLKGRAGCEGKKPSWKGQGRGQEQLKFKEGSTKCTGPWLSPHISD